MLEQVKQFEPLLTTGGSGSNRNYGLVKAPPIKNRTAPTNTNKRTTFFN